MLSCRYARRAADAPKPWRWRHLAGPGVPMVHPHLCRWRRRVREPRLTLFGPILREGLDARSASGRRLKCASTIWMISPQRKRGKPNAGAALFDHANPLPPGSASIQSTSSPAAFPTRFAASHREYLPSPFAAVRRRARAFVRLVLQGRRRSWGASRELRWRDQTHAMA